MSETTEKCTIDKNGIKRRARRSYTAEFKQQIVDLYNLGEYTHDNLCREYELTPSTLTRWIRQSRNSNTEAKKVIIAEFDWAEEAGYTLGNPDFAALYLAEATAEIKDRRVKLSEVEW